MSHAAQLTTHAAPPAPISPQATQAHAPIDAGLWLYLVAAPIGFALILASIIYLSELSF